MENAAIDVNVDETQRRLSAGEVIVVDVREPEEWDCSHIPGDDVWHVPLSELAESASVIPDDKPIIFVCRGGGRSTLAAQTFRQFGREAYSSVGGMLAWHAAELPLVPAGAGIAAH